MKISLLIAGLLATFGLFAQPETSVYRDQHASYKRGLEFYQQKLFGKAREEFQQVLGRQYTAEQQAIPTFVKESQLYDALSALRLERPEAEDELLNFIHKNEPGGMADQAKRAVAEYYYDVQDFKKAMKYFDMVTTEGLDNKQMADMAFKQGYTYFVNKQFLKAKPYFRQIINNTQDEHYYPANYYYGVNAFFLDDYNSALESFQKIIKSKQYSRIVPYNICQIYFARKEYQKLIAYAAPLTSDKAMRSPTEIGYLLGQSYFEEKEYEKALPWMEEYVKASPKVSKENMFQLATTQMETGKYAAAAPNFEQLTTLDEPLGQLARYNLGRCLNAIGQKNDARNAFQGAANMEYNTDIQKDANFLYGKLSAEQSYENDAVEALQKVSIDDANYPEAQQLLGGVFETTRDFNKAIGILEAMPKRTAKLNESLQRVYFYRGVELYTDNKRAEAIQMFDKALKSPIDPEITAQAHFWKADNYYDAKQYSEAIKEFNVFLRMDAKNLPDNVSEGTSHYGLGYSYLKQDKAVDATKHFEDCIDYIRKNKGTIKDAYVLGNVYPDALVRAGDCYLLQNKYTKAKKYLEEAINSKTKNADYATFQHGQILGLEGDNGAKTAELTKVLNQFPTSAYADDALMERGRAFMALGSKDNAIKDFKLLTEKYATSDLLIPAYLQLGLLALNSASLPEATQYYETIFKHNPSTEQARIAFDGLEECYAGKPEEYTAFRNSLNGYQLSSSEVEGLAFKSAIKAYTSQEYEKAVQQLSNYLQKYPQSSNSLEARYSRGESLYALKRNDEALTDFDDVLKKGNSTFADACALHAGNITLKKKDYASAYIYFLQLEGFAQDDAMRLEAIYGALQSAYHIGKKDQIPALADRLMKQPTATNDQKGEANFYMGKVAFDAKRWDEARIMFADAFNLAQGKDFAAESYYLQCLSAFKKGDKKTAETLARASADNIGDDENYWHKSYLILADVLADTKPTTSRSIYEKIIKTSTIAENKADATAKLKALNDKTQQKSKVQEPPKEGDLLQLDNGGK